MKVISLFRLSPLPQVLWLLSFDDKNTLADAVDKYCIGVPPIQWLAWIPQLLTCLVGSEGKPLLNLISQVGLLSIISFVRRTDWSICFGAPIPLELNEHVKGLVLCLIEMNFFCSFQKETVCHQYPLCQIYAYCFPPAFLIIYAKHCY